MGGATDNFLCPVSAMYNFIHQSTFISGPLFTYSDGSYLTQNRVSLMLRSCFGNCRINTHSFRIGGASTMASAGIPDSTIMIMGRWSSNAYQKYLRLSDSLITEPHKPQLEHFCFLKLGTQIFCSPSIKFYIFFTSFYLWALIWHINLIFI